MSSSFASRQQVSRMQVPIRAAMAAWWSTALWSAVGTGWSDVNTLEAKGLLPLLLWRPNCIVLVRKVFIWPEGSSYACQMVFN